MTIPDRMRPELHRVLIVTLSLRLTKPESLNLGLDYVEAWHRGLVKASMRVWHDMWGIC